MAALPANALTPLHINEIRPDALPGPQEEFLKASVELFNPGPSSAPTTGLSLLNAAGTTIATLPSWVVPAGGFVTVVFGTGTNDADFTDGAGTYFTAGDSIATFDGTSDECALYDGLIVPVSLADYVAWSRSGPYAGGFSAGAAQTQTLWTAGDFVDRSAHGFLSSFGLAPDGYDHDTSADWIEYDWGIYFVGGGGTTIQNPVQQAPLHDALLAQADPDLRWHVIAGADSFHLQVDDDSLFASPDIDLNTTATLFTVTNSLADGAYYWRVRIYRGGFEVQEHARWIFFKLWGYSIPKAGGGGIPTIAAAIPGFTPQIQHKDSQLLCIYNPRAARRPGCAQAAGAQGPWDNAHAIGVAHVPGCQHCSMYCTRASIQMINNVYGGTLSQDRIAYDLFPGAEAGLGHNQGTGLAPRTATYHWAMGLAAGLITRTVGKPTFATVKTEIDAGRPVYVDGQNHATVCWGYVEIVIPLGPTIQLVLIANPWPGTGGFFGYGAWQPDGAGWGVGGYFTLPAMGVAARAQEASVTTDTDGDGVMDFDELNRFCSSRMTTDRDTDQIADKLEIASYTFHSTHHAHNTNAIGFSDLDGDGLRTECDCDSDADNDYDGGEDVNGNGINPQAGETDVYNAASSALTIMVAQSACGMAQFTPQPTGGTMRGGETFAVDITQQMPCNPPGAGQALGVAGLVSTNAAGNIDNSMFGCYPAGTYRMVIDAIPNGTYDAGCDPVVCFTIQAPVPVGLESFVLTSSANDVQLHWVLNADAQASLAAVRVQRAEAAEGPWSVISDALTPRPTMEHSDAAVTVGREYWYRLELEPRSGGPVVTAAARITVQAAVLVTALHPPVARGGSVEFRYSLAPGGAGAELAIFDVAGRRVQLLAHGQREAGAFTIQWDRRNGSGVRVPRGVYFVRLADGPSSWSRKFVVASE
jgi:hypothetical protein